MGYYYNHYYSHTILIFKIHYLPNVNTLNSPNPPHNTWSPLAENFTHTHASLCAILSLIQTPLSLSYTHNTRSSHPIAMCAPLGEMSKHIGWWGREVYVTYMYVCVCVCVCVHAHMRRKHSCDVRNIHIYFIEIRKK